MNKPVSKMSKGTDKSAFDLDSFIQEADPLATVTKPTPKSPAPKKPQATPRATKPVPWAEAGDGPLLKVTIKMTPKQKAILDYLKAETGLAIAQQLLRGAMPAAEQKATEIWKQTRK